MRRLDLVADCDRCAGLCCIATSFEASAAFAITKHAGVACPNLRADCRCAIHDDRVARGFRGCTTYDCYGAGPRATRMFDADQAAFLRLREVHELVWLLTEAAKLCPSDELRAELSHEVAALDARIDVGAHARSTHALLRRVGVAVLRARVGVMARQVLFIQGAGDGVHDRWDQKLVDSLERELGVTVRYPRMPDEADPHYAAWKPALLGELESLDDHAIVVGHSMGGAMLLHVLAEQPPAVRLGGIFIVAAPFIGEGGWPSDEIQPRPDLSHRLPAGVPIILYQGDKDETVPFTHLDLYARALPQATVRAVARGEHQLGNDLSIVAGDIRALT